MAKFIELTNRYSSDSIIVNVEQIVSYNSNHHLGDGWEFSHIVTTHTNFDVKEDAKEIGRLLSLADCLLVLNEENMPKSKELTNLYKRDYR